MRKNSVCVRFVLLTILGGILVLQPHSAAKADYLNVVVGNGTPGSCTEAAFDSKLAMVQAVGDGSLSFNCGGPATIIFTNQKVIDSYLVVIDGGGQITLSGKNSTRLFYVKPGGFELHNITLTNGYSGNGYGGAILAEQGTSVYIINSTIKNSRTKTNTGLGGGAILSFSTATNTPTVSIENSVIQGNESDYAAVNTIGKLVISDSLILDNIGGGLSVGGLTTITNTNIYNNTNPGIGGGIFATDTANVYVTGGLISGNEALSGAGIYNRNIISLTDLTVQSNESDNDGGGIYNAGDVYLNRVTFLGNFSGTVNGSKIYNQGFVQARNSTFAGHSTVYPGGSAFFNASVGTLVFESSTLWGNTWVAGQVTVFNETGGAVAFRNTIIGKNDADAGPNCAGAPLKSSNFSLFEDDSCSWQSGGGNSIRPGMKMGPLDQNGGLTRTMMPPSDSPAIDAGQCNVSIDQRGVSRPQGPACDIGAVERSPGDDGYFVYLPLIVK